MVDDRSVGFIHELGTTWLPEDNLVKQRNKVKAILWTTEGTPRIIFISRGLKCIFRSKTLCALCEHTAVLFGSDHRSWGSENQTNFGSNSKHLEQICVLRIIIWRFYPQTHFFKYSNQVYYIYVAWQFRTYEYGMFPRQVMEGIFFSSSCIWTGKIRPFYIIHNNTIDIKI